MYLRIYKDKPDGKREGSVHFDDHTKGVMVSFPIKGLRKRIHHYLTNTNVHSFPTEKDGRLGQKPCQITPTDSLNQMIVAMNHLYAHTGVRVDWSHPDNNLKSMIPEKKLEPDKTNKPIVKSIDGETYELI